MGTWDMDSFSNDQALDWLAILEEQGAKALFAAFTAVREAKDGYADGDRCQEGLIAAEVLAAQLGRPHANIDEDVDAWVARNPGPPAPALVHQATDSVDAILAHSELNDLWKDSSNYEAWLVEVRGLRSRLG